MSARPDPRQFGRRHDRAGWTIRARLEHRSRMKARRIAWASAFLFCLGMWASLGCTFLEHGEGAAVILLVGSFGALIVGVAAAGEA